MRETMHESCNAQRSHGSDEGINRNNVDPANYPAILVLSEQLSERTSERSRTFVICSSISTQEDDITPS
jgi:hypothetical protein